MGNGVGQGGIMGQLESRMGDSSNPLRGHIAEMLMPMFKKFGDAPGMPGAFGNKLLYGDKPPVAPTTQPQGIVSALPKAPPPSPVVPTQGYRVGPY
jgi:hypothetical protein